MTGAEWVTAAAVLCSAILAGRCVYLVREARDQVRIARTSAREALSDAAEAHRIAVGLWAAAVGDIADMVTEPGADAECASCGAKPGFGVVLCSTAMFTRELGKPDYYCKDIETCAQRRRATRGFAW